MTAPDRDATPRLRFDKVALRLVQAVRGAVEGIVPDGLCVLFAVTAPIREPSKTATALVETIRAQLSVPVASADHAEMLHGNGIRVRVMTSRWPDAARVAGFVHNPDPPPDALLDLMQSLLRRDAAPALAFGETAAPNAQKLRTLCEQLLAAIPSLRSPPGAAAARWRSPTRN